MKRILLPILIVSVFLLVACSSPTTPPVIQHLPVSNITETSAVISWQTDRPTSSKIIYGPAASDEDFSITDDRLSSTHSFELKRLQPDTSYCYTVYSEDANGNEAISSGNMFQTEALPPDKGIIIGTVLFADGTPANHVFMYLFKGDDSTCFAFCASDEDGYYIFSELPFDRYEIYSSGIELGSECGGWTCVDKEIYRAFNRPPEVVNLTENQLTIAPTRTHFKDVTLYYQNEYLDTNQPELSWDAVPTAAYYKIRIVVGYLNEGNHEDYDKEITVFSTSIVWPEQLAEMHYMVSVYAYDQNDIYLTDTYETFWIGPSAK